MPMDSEKLLSKTIHFLRFPLIFSVVVSHVHYVGIVINGEASVQPGMFPIYDFIYRLIRCELASLDVSSFFFFAGFLFFYKTNFTLETYANKLKNRVHTLLVPYLFWNALALVLMLLANVFLTQLASGDNDSILNKSFTEILSMFWSYKADTPVAGQFWFIRDLMVMGLISPLLYLAIRYLKWIWVPVMGYCWVAGVPDIALGLSFDALFFFSLGAWFSIHKQNFVTLFMPARKWLLPLFLVLVGVNMVLWYQRLIVAYNIVHNINVLVGMAMVFGWVARGIELSKLKTNDVIWGSTFFVYASHFLLVVFSLKVWLKLCYPVNETMLIVGYFLIPLVVTAIGIGTYQLLKKIMPRFTAVITGGR